MKRAITMLLACCALVGVAVAAIMMFVAWQYNPQGEFHELASDGSQVVHWGTWGLIGILWFLGVFVPISVVGTGVIGLSQHFDRRRAARYQATDFRSPG
jgi:hypothetical protein